MNDCDNIHPDTYMPMIDVNRNESELDNPRKRQRVDPFNNNKTTGS